jgi:hypothetical protein
MIIILIICLSFEYDNDHCNGGGGGGGDDDVNDDDDGGDDNSPSFCNLSYDRSVASSKASSPKGAI